MADLIAKGLSDTFMAKLRKRKEGDGFKDKDWAEWLMFLVKDERIEGTPRELMQSHTANALLLTWCQNFSQNLPEMNGPGAKMISDLVPERIKTNPDEERDRPEGTAIVIGRGPSVFKHNHLKMLAESDYAGTILATDGMLIECLRAGVTPDRYRNFLSVSVDGNRELIRRWYDDPLVDKYGKGIKAVLTTSVAHNVYERCAEAGIDIHWFHPLFDDWRRNESFSKIMTLMTTTDKHDHGIAKVACGGNAGSTAWIFSHTLLRHAPTCLIGFDFGYPEGTPLSQTPYYSTLIRVAKGDVDAIKSAYREIVNPNGEKAFADAVFWNYREAFLELSKAINHNFLPTWNCTEGGTLYEPTGELVKWATFKEFLGAHKE